MSAPASVPSLGVTNTYAQLQEQHNSKDLRSTPFSPTTYDSYGQRYATREGLVSLDSASDTVTNSASTSDGLFPTIQAPGLEFGALP